MNKNFREKLSVLMPDYLIGKDNEVITITTKDGKYGASVVPPKDCSSEIIIAIARMLNESFDEVMAK